MNTKPNSDLSMKITQIPDIISMGGQSHAQQ